MRTQLTILLAAVALAAGTTAQKRSASAAWSPIDNARVHVWSDNGSAPPSGTLATVRVTLDGRVSYAAAGARATPPGEAAGDFVVNIEIKDPRVPPYENRSGHPAAFPRPNVKKALENDRVVVWDYTWTPGVPTPTHFHDKDVVVIYLEDGALKSVEPSGQSAINEHYYGFTKFNPGNRVHFEELAKGKARAIIVELK
jgi:hypothetical protein